LRATIVDIRMVEKVVWFDSLYSMLCRMVLLQQAPQRFETINLDLFSLPSRRLLTVFILDLALLVRTEITHRIIRTSLLSTIRPWIKRSAR
jgi:hypothetical protein